MDNINYDDANHSYIAMPVYNLIEYSDNYSDKSGSLWQFKRDEVPDSNDDLSINNSKSFAYKAALLGKAANHNNGKSFVKDVKIVLPLKYLSNFWRSLEIPLIKCKVYLEPNWIEDCILSSAGDSAKFEITDAKLHAPIVTLSTRDSANLTKQLSKGFKRSIYRNSYETKPATVIEKGKTFTNYLMHHFKALKYYLFLLIFLLQVLMLIKKQV